MLATVDAWADRIADFVEENRQPVFVLVGLLLASRFVKLKVGLGK